MTFYEKYLQGVEWGKIQAFVWPLLVSAYAYMQQHGVPLPVSIVACILLGLVLVFLALIQPKGAEQLAGDPKVIAAAARVAVQPVVDEAQSQIQDAVTGTVEDATEKVKAAVLDPLEIATRMEAAAAALRGEGQ